MSYGKEETARHIVVVECDGRTQVLYANQPPVVTVVDAALWDQVEDDWFYRVVGDQEVHVMKSGDDYMVRRMQGGMDEDHPGCYDSFAIAMAEGQKIVDALYAAMDAASDALATAAGG